MPEAFHPFRLKGSIGEEMSMDLDDALATKKALHRLGHLRLSEYGLTPYPDRPMLDGLKSFQRANGLKVDGLMRPEGPTMRKLDAALQARRESAPPRRRPGVTGQDGHEVAVAPAVPAIVYQVAAFFGMTIAAAHAWWSSQTAAKKAHVIAQIQRARGADGNDAPTEEDCERLFEIDTATCNGVSRHRGKRAAARCHASAMARYGACLAGKPKDQWPPLDTWNN